MQTSWTSLLIFILNHAYSIRGFVGHIVLCILWLAQRRQWKYPSQFTWASQNSPFSCSHTLIRFYTKHRKRSVFCVLLCQISNVWLERDKVTYMIYSIIESDQTNIIAESIVDHNEGNAESLIQPCKEESWPLYRECVTNQEYKIASWLWCFVSCESHLNQCLLDRAI